MTFSSVLVVLGVKLSTTVAGFAGGVVSLAFVQKLNRWQAVCAVVVGCLTATYLNPVVDAKLGIAQPEFVNCTAFVIGLCGMNIVPLIKAAVSKSAQQLAGRFQPTQGDGGAP
jgi:hypothetical protein